jgi:hypothetical protein
MSQPTQTKEQAMSNRQQREELADIIDDGIIRARHAGSITDAILAAGYQKDASK